MRVLFVAVSTLWFVGSGVGGKFSHMLGVLDGPAI
jgi:hypothetical protein